jgi:hypothetical protein
VVYADFESTVVSQITLTLGGFSPPYVLSSMLAEVLPFLRQIASAIESDLGDDHPAILPTTMMAFAMTSILLGFLFLLLAALRCGNFVGYFPETVMTGVVGMRRSEVLQTTTDNNRGCWLLFDHPRTRNDVSTTCASPDVEGYI